VLELKLLADVGLIGYPNAGKSTLISRISRAKPKIADYPFTTLVPNLGVVQYKDRLSFVVADIPGLIEGASEGVGLGHQFLRHVERCRVLVHLLDLSAVLQERDAVKDFDTLNRELARYSKVLADKPQVVVANKLDLPFAREALPKFIAAMKKRKIEVLEMSGATGEGIPAVLDAVAKVLYAPEVPRPKAKVRHAERKGAKKAARGAKPVTPKAKRPAQKATRKASPAARKAKRPTKKKGARAR
jgi:GTP-binding protein